VNHNHNHKTEGVMDDESGDDERDGLTSG